MKCPNCKKNAEQKTVGDIEYVNCSKCGWFKVTQEGEYITTNEPIESQTPDPVPALEIDDAGGETKKTLTGPAVDPPAIVKDDDDDDDWYDFEITLRRKKKVTKNDS